MRRVPPAGSDGFHERERVCVPARARFEVGGDADQTVVEYAPDAGPAGETGRASRGVNAEVRFVRSRAPLRLDFEPPAPARRARAQGEALAVAPVGTGFDGRGG